jgi:hypothetical protein
MNKLQYTCSMVFIAFLVTGCVSTQKSINNQYAKINFSNGVGTNEAVTIAQKSLMESDKFKDYKIKSARVLHDAFVRDYRDHWFVSFDPKSFDLSFWRYLVVIEKESGQVEFEDAYIPYEVVDYDWVFKK